MELKEQEILAQRQKRRRIRTYKLIFRWSILVLIIIGLVFGSIELVNFFFNKDISIIKTNKALNVKTLTVPDYVDVQIITNITVRKGRELKEIKNIVVHYTGNPGSTAQNNRDYFNKITTTVCSHFVVGLDGEIIQCLPIDEVSAASNHRNKDTISIEVCHPDATGEFNAETYLSLVKLTAWLCDNSGLDKNDIIRHYDVTGKNCPLYFVEHEDAFETFKSDVEKEMEKL